MPRQDVWLKERLDLIEAKLDKVTTEVIPDLMVKFTEITTEKTTEAKTTAKIHSRIYGGIALLISAVSLAVAFYK